MIRSRGFTLTELIIVIVLIGVISAAASSFFSRTGAFNAVAARDQLIAMAMLAQKRALADAASSRPVFLQITQSSSAWTLSITQNAQILMTESLQRPAAALQLNGSSLADGESYTLRYAGDGSTGHNEQWTVVAENTYPLCITSTGFSHHGSCQP